MDIYKKLINFVTVDLSAFYLDIAKDIVYIEGEDSHKRRSMQTALYDVAVRLTKLLTPVLPHTTEEIWGYLKEPEEFAQLSEMPAVNHYNNELETSKNFAEFMDIRSEVFKALEKARNEKLIGKSFEAQVVLYASEDVIQLFKKLQINVRQALIVSALEVKSLDDAPAEAEKHTAELSIVVGHAKGEVCPRCRMIKEDVGSDNDFPTLCASCAAIVKADFPDAVSAGLEE